MSSYFKWISIQIIYIYIFTYNLWSKGQYNGQNPFENWPIPMNPSKKANKCQSTNTWIAQTLIGIILIVLGNIFIISELWNRQRSHRPGL